MKIARKYTGIIKIVAVFVILVGMIAAIGTIIYIHLYEEQYFANKKFEELSRSYYEDNIYGSFIKEHSGDNLEAAFSTVKNTFTIKLRQILNFELLEHNQNYRSVFENETFSCDTNTSYVKITVHAPYGQNDYDAEFKLECEKK